MIHTIVSDLTAGNILAKQVHLEGNHFLPIGTVVTPKHLLILKTWGIKYVWIEGSPKKPETETLNNSPLAHKGTLNLTDIRFSKCDQYDLLVIELKRIANTLGRIR
jgi:hypothetical protein